MFYHLKHRKRLKRTLLIRNCSYPSCLLQNILFWGKHHIDKEGETEEVFSQSPTTVQRKSNCDCCYMQQCKKFKVHISGRSMNNYSINQACFSSAHPDANQGICQGGLSKARIDLHKFN